MDGKPGWALAHGEMPRGISVEEAPPALRAALVGRYGTEGAGDGRARAAWTVGAAVPPAGISAEAAPRQGVGTVSRPTGSARPPAPPRITRERPAPVSLLPPPVDGVTDEDQVGGAPAPGRLDAQGRLLAGRQGKVVEVGTPAFADALEQMALALEAGAGWPQGATSTRGQRMLLDRAREALAMGMDRDPVTGLPEGLAVRLRVLACSVAAVLARRGRPGVAEQAVALVAEHLPREPRETVRSAMAAHVLGLEKPPAPWREAVDRAALLPAAPRPHVGAVMRARHLVYAPEYRALRDAYVAAGYRVVTERPLVLQKEPPGAPAVRVELRRSSAVALVTPDPPGTQPDLHALLVTGTASAVCPGQPPPCAVMVAALRRDPFGVPRIHERFPGCHVVGVARGDRPLEDAAFADALLTGLAQGLAWEDLRARAVLRAPLAAARTLWPHQPGALRARGGAPAVFATDMAAALPHALTWALARPSRRPADLRWRNDTPDATSHLALEVACALACAPLDGEDVPVLEPAGFHEGLPDVDVQTGAALWRASLTRGLCGQAEEALAALLTLHAASQRAQLLLDPPRLALMRGAARAARVLVLAGTTVEFAREVLSAVLAHAGLPSSLGLEALAAAAADEDTFTALAVEHAGWLQG